MAQSNGRLILDFIGRICDVTLSLCTIFSQFQSLGSEEFDTSTSILFKKNIKRNIT